MFRQCFGFAPNISPHGTSKSLGASFLPFSMSWPNTLDFDEEAGGATSPSTAESDSSAGPDVRPATHPTCWGPASGGALARIAAEFPRMIARYRDSLQKPGHFSGVLSKNNIVVVH